MSSQTPAFCAAAVVSFLAVVATAAAGGGYAPTTWGWAALGPAAVAAAALLLRSDVRATRSSAAFALLFGLFVVWTALSLLWTDSVPRTMNEVERDLVYVATIGAVLALPRNRAALTGAVLAACVAVCGAGLVTRLFPGRYGLDAESAYRLARPLGYWNALGALAAIGTLLALGLATDVRRRVVRSLAAAAPVVLVPTLIFTASRGSAVALAAGFGVAFALHPARGRLALTALVAGLPATAGAVLAATSRALTSEPSSLGAASDEGRTLAIALAVLAVIALGTPAVVDRAAPKLPRVRLGQRSAAGLAAISVGVGLLFAVAFAGRAYDAFRAPTAFGEQGLRSHLFSLSGHERTTYWRIAMDDYRAHPALGSGAGTYDLHWTRDRPYGVGARSAHSLYVETLAELGPVGLLLLLGALAAPFLALASARTLALVPALASAYAAYLVHAAADWDWEVPALTLAALVCASALASSDERRVRVRAGPFLAAAAVAVALAAFAFQRGNDAIAEAGAAQRDGRPRDALSAAERASRWAPWAAEPWRVRADAERALGLPVAARESARRAIARDPRDWIGWYQLAYLTDGAERERAASRVRELNPLAPPIK